MGASVKTIDKHYGHLARDSEDAIRARLDARADRSGVVVRRIATDALLGRDESRDVAGQVTSASDETRTRDLRRDRLRCNWLRRLAELPRPASWPTATASTDAALHGKR